MSDSILKTATCDTIPHQSNISSMRSIAVTLFSVFALVSSAGNPIPVSIPSTMPIIKVDTSEPSYSMLSERGIFVYSNSKNYEQIQENIRKIRAISLLHENWDGDGATSFSTSIIDTTIKIIYKLSTQPDVFPTLRNSIQLEYENARDEYLEFEVFDDHIKCFFYDHKNPSVTRNVKIEEISSIVETFYERSI